MQFDISYTLQIMFIPLSGVCIDDGEQVLVDTEGKDYKEITQHVMKIMGKSQWVLDEAVRAAIEGNAQDSVARQRKLF